MAAAQFTLYLNNCNVNNAVRIALIDQGLDNCDSLLGHNDSDMKAVCRRLIQPGGTMPGRRAAAGRANRGTPVSFVAEKNLRKACFFRNDMDRIERPFVAATAPLAMVHKTLRSMARFNLQKQDSKGRRSGYYSDEDAAGLMRLSDGKLQKFSNVDEDFEDYWKEAETTLKRTP